jgi:hypothetical protein
MRNSTDDDRLILDLLIMTRGVLRRHGYRPLAKSVECPELAVDRVQMALRQQAPLLEGSTT